MIRLFHVAALSVLLATPALAQQDEPTAEPITLRAMAGPAPAQVTRIVDGDTFRALVTVWPGVVVTTSVRVLGVDTPEMKGRCPEERAAAHRAKERLGELLGDSATLTQIAPDKYAGRVDARVSTPSGDDVAALLIAEGHARPYSGGKRQGWCPETGR